MLKCLGNVIVSGIWKSGLIVQKIIANLASIGTPGFFLHPAEAFHGDSVMIGREDMVILLSYSGETDELLMIIPFLKWQGNTIIVITGNVTFMLAWYEHYHLNVTISKEACPLQLAPTTSQKVIGGLQLYQMGIQTIIYI